MKSLYITTLVSLVLLVLFFTIGIPVAKAYSCYSGKEAFQSQESYSLFKEEVIKAGSNWKTMEVLASEPPIIVKFSINTPKEYEFPYGNKSSQYPVFMQVMILITALVFAWVNPWLPFLPFK